MRQVYKCPKYGALFGVVEELAVTHEGQPAAWVDWRADTAGPLDYQRKQALPAGFPVKELTRLEATAPSASDVDNLRAWAAELSR